MTYDILIRNGRIVDGSGLASFIGDVAVKDGRIVAVGRVPKGEAAKEIDATGLIVSAGWIDIHTHYDSEVFWDSQLSNSGANGICTIEMGHCGISLAPCKPGDGEAVGGILADLEAIPHEVLQHGVPWTWDSFGEMLDTLEKQPLGVNVTAYCGHAALRYYAMGADAFDRDPTRDEMEQMKGLLRDALDAGAFGFSYSQFGPVPPGSYEEVKELASVMEGYHPIGFNTSGPDFTPEGRELMIDISVKLGCHVIYSINDPIPQLPLKWKRMLTYAEEANRRGARIFGLTRVWAASQPRPNFDYAMPNSIIAYEGSKDVKNSEEHRARIASREVRDQMKSIVITRRTVPGTDFIVEPFPWTGIVVMCVALESNEHHVGRSIDEIAGSLGKHPVDAFLDLVLEDDLKAEFRLLSGSQAAMAEIVNHSSTIIGFSDGGAHLAGPTGTDFAVRFLSEWVRDKKVMLLEQGIFKITFMPASLMGLSDRGLLRVGLNADITIFDYEKLEPGEQIRVADLPHSDKTRSTAVAKGIHYTIVNGKIAWQDGKPIQAVGRVLRSYDYRGALAPAA